MNKNRNFQKSNFRRNDSRNNSFNSRPREMHKATCAECKQSCEVPFKPTPGKEVLCQNCFKKKNPKRDNGFQRNNSRNNSRNNNFHSRQREMHKVTCSKCKKECEVPFKPTPGKDVFCQDCFKKNNPRN